MAINTRVMTLLRHAGVGAALFAASALNGWADQNQATAGDGRQYVEMPAEARALMRQDMLSHLTTISQILDHLANGRLDEAGVVAEEGMGESTMGKHRASGMGPGRFMPLEMRQLGWGMHAAASEFARVAKQGDLPKAYAALYKLSGSCVACHHIYRTR